MGRRSRRSARNSRRRAASGSTRPVPGFTTEMMNKLRAQIMAGDPPACLAAQGPRDCGLVEDRPDRRSRARWSLPPATKRSSRRTLQSCTSRSGKWIALPLQIYSTNMLFLSKRAMDKAKADKIPVTWADFNDLAEKMKAGGITYPIANGGTRPDDGQKFEASLAGISPDIIPRAIMQSRQEGLGGSRDKGCLRTGTQDRQLDGPQRRRPTLCHQPEALRRRRHGHDDQGGWAQGVLRNAGFKFDDFIIAPGPSDNSRPVLPAECRLLSSSGSARSPICRPVRS